MDYQFAVENIKKNYTMSDVEMAGFAAKLSDFDWKVFEIIVENGISEEKIAKEVCVRELVRNNEPCVCENTVWRSIKLLVTLNLFEAIKTITGWRTFNILALTTFGNSMYTNAFLKNPPAQEHQLISAVHDNVHHGYMIKDTAEILKTKFDYWAVTTDPKHNTFKFRDGLASVPDVCAMRHGGGLDCFEVECGNHHQADMEDKLTKLCRLDCRIILVGQNRKVVSGTLKRQVDSWVAHIGREKLLARGKQVILTTIMDLSKGKATYLYNFESDEPICFIERKRKEVTLDEE